jgi:hypothetical protein
MQTTGSPADIYRQAMMDFDFIEDMSLFPNHISESMASA